MQGELLYSRACILKISLAFSLAFAQHSNCSTEKKIILGKVESYPYRSSNTICKLQSNTHITLIIRFVFLKR